MSSALQVGSGNADAAPYPPMPHPTILVFWPRSHPYADARLSLHQAFRLQTGLLHLGQELPEAVKEALHPGPVAQAGLHSLLLPEILLSRAQRSDLEVEGV